MAEVPQRPILVVEDSETLNELVREALSQAGFACLAAYDGEEALARFRADRPGGVVLDLNIPRVHGTEVLRTIKRESPFTVVIVLTGHGSDQTAMEALKLGADDYLTKPVRHDRLVRTLQVCLQRAELQRKLDVPAFCPSFMEEHHLTRVFFQAPSALLHADESLTIRAANRAAARLLACPAEDLIGRPLDSVAAEGVRTGWLEALRRDAALPKGYEGEIHMQGGPEVFPAAVAAVEGPDPGHLILAIRDLSRQKALEQSYYESKKLASLGRVVEGVAHEVRNPLISIGGFARKLQEHHPAGTRDRRYLDVVVAEVERLEKMVHDIEGYVQFSRNRRPQFAPVHLGETLAKAIQVAVEPRTGQGVQVNFAPPGDLPAIYADRRLLRELFEGLLENAMDAMQGGGRLSVDMRVGDGWLHVHIRDTGVGITQKDLEEIFDPFFTSKTSGAGLGLARAYLIVEDHSGTIDFDSTPQLGTTCTVSLPIDRRKVVRDK